MSDSDLDDLHASDGMLTKAAGFRLDSDAESRQLDDFGLLSGLPSIGGVTGVHEPPVNLGDRAAMVGKSTRLRRCVAVRSSAVSSFGFEIVPSKKMVRLRKNDESTDAIESKFIKQRDALEAFFECPNEELSLGSLNKMVFTDYEATGNGYYEVTRDNRGDPKAMYHIRATTVRVVQNDRGFVQIRGPQRRYFKRYGDPRVMDAVTGLFAEEILAMAAAGDNADPEFTVKTYLSSRASASELKDNEAFEAKVSRMVKALEGFKVKQSPEGKLDLPIPRDRRASEVIQFKVYDPCSSYYGVPRWESAAVAIGGNHFAAARNMRFFFNDAIPRGLIIVSGGKLSDESQKLLTQSFKQNKGIEYAHSLVVLHVDRSESMLGDEGANPTVTLNPLTVGTTEDASFEKYRSANNAEIGEACGIPSSFFVETETNKATAMASLKRVNEQEFEPDRKEVAFIINQKIVKPKDSGFGFDLAELKLLGPNLVDPLEQAQYIRLIATSGGFSPNDVREILGMDPYPNTDEFDFARWPIPVAVVRENKLDDGVPSPGDPLPDDPDDPDDSEEEVPEEGAPKEPAPPAGGAKGAPKGKPGDKPKDKPKGKPKGKPPAAKKQASSGGDVVKQAVLTDILNFNPNPDN